MRRTWPGRSGSKPETTIAESRGLGNRYSLIGGCHWQLAASVGTNRKAARDTKRFHYPELRFTIVPRSCFSRHRGIQYRDAPAREFHDGVWLRRLACDPTAETAVPHQKAGVPHPLLLSKGRRLTPTTKEIPHPPEDGRMGHPRWQPAASVGTGGQAARCIQREPLPTVRLARTCGVGRPSGAGAGPGCRFVRG